MMLFSKQDGVPHDCTQNHSMDTRSAFHFLPVQSDTRKLQEGEGIRAAVIAAVWLVIAMITNGVIKF